MCTAVSKTEDITGTMAHYPYMEEKQVKTRQIQLHQKFCEDAKTKKRTHTEMETLTLPTEKKK